MVLCFPIALVNIELWIDLAMTAYAVSQQFQYRYWQSEPVVCGSTIAITASTTAIAHVVAFSPPGDILGELLVRPKEMEESEDPAIASKTTADYLLSHRRDG